MSSITQVTMTNPFGENDIAGKVVATERTAYYLNNCFRGGTNQYAFQVWVKSSNTSFSIQIGQHSKSFTLTADTWTKCEYVTPGAISPSSYRNMQLIFNSGTYYIYQAKLEIGTTHTDWSPAPEDTEMYIDDLAGDLQEQVDNKIESHSTTSDPSTAWNTLELKKQHKGDLWYNPSKKETKRWDLKGDGTYAWTLQTDGVAEALAQSKAQVFNTRPTKGRYNVGDLWINYTDVGEAVVKICKTARAEGVTGAESDWVESLKYTDDTAANNVSDDLHKNYRSTEEISADIENGENGIGMAFNKKVSEIKIGARNLLVNTNRGKQNWLWATDLTTYIVDEEDYYGIKILKATSPGSTSNLDLQFTQFSPSYSFIEGQEYCLGFDIYLETTGKQIEVELQSLVNSNFISNFSLSNGGNIQKGVWTSVEGSLKLDFTPDDASQLILNIKGLSASANVIKIANLRLEYGNKISDWTPAPEEGLDVEADYQKRIAAVESSINANETGLLAKVSDVEILINGDGTEENPGINEEITKLKKDVALQITPEQLSIEVSEQLQNLDGVDTKMGFKFNKDGLNLSKEGAATSTLLNEDGMRIRDNSGNEMLTANHEGVDAYNLHATTYLIIGSATRFEDYGSGRTGCFPQSGNE